MEALVKPIFGAYRPQKIQEEAVSLVRKMTSRFL